MYLKVPQTEEEWLEIASVFEEQWQYPHCLGAIDGKHVVLQPPAGAGSHFYNYKHTHSIILLEVAGPSYSFHFISFIHFIIFIQGKYSMQKVKLIYKLPCYKRK